MSDNSADISVNSQLGKIIEDLQKISKASEGVSRGLKSSTENVGKTVDEQTRKVQTGMDKLKSFGRSVADSLKDDFKALASIHALTGGLKLSNQFSGSVKEAVSLSDTIRKVGMTFGIASRDFSRFQNTLVQGLGEVGLSSDVATSSLQALAKTPVRGEKNLLAYSKSAGMLASIGGEKGREGDIAGGLSGVLQAKGGNVNDASQMQALSESVRRISTATGHGPTEILGNMKELFTGMSSDFRKKFSSKGISSLATAGAVAGPNATNFIQDYLKSSKTQRAGMDARGVGKIFGNDGIDTSQVARLYSQAKNLGGGDVRLGVKAATGIESDQDAEGFIRLAESLDQVRDAQDRLKNMTGTLSDQYKQTMTAGEAFNASINRMKKTVSGPLSFLTNKGTDMLSSASQSDSGSAAVVGGGAVLAAMLAGRGLKGLGGSLGLGGMAKAKGEEFITGEKVMPVRVVNASEIGGSVGGAMSGAAGFLGKAAGVGGALAAGMQVGSMANGYLESNTQGKTTEGFEGNAMERLIFKLDKLVGGQASNQIMQGIQTQKVKIDVDFKSKEFKRATPPGRGVSN